MGHYDATHSLHVIFMYVFSFLQIIFMLLIKVVRKIFWLKTNTGYSADFVCRISGIRPDIENGPISGKLPDIQHYKLSGYMVSG